MAPGGVGQVHDVLPDPAVHAHRADHRLERKERGPVDDG
jgi:hypothetical protein